MWVHTLVAVPIAAPMLERSVVVGLELGEEAFATERATFAFPFDQELVCPQDANDICACSLQELRKGALPLDLVLSLATAWQGKLVTHIGDLLPKLGLPGCRTLLDHTFLALLGYDHRHGLPQGSLSGPAASSQTPN